MVRTKSKNHTRVGTVVARAYIYRDRTQAHGVRITHIDEGARNLIEAIPISIEPRDLMVKRKPNGNDGDL